MFQRSMDVNSGMVMLPPNFGQFGLEIYGLVPDHAFIAVFTRKASKNTMA